MANAGEKRFGAKKIHRSGQRSISKIIAGSEVEHCSPEAFFHTLLQVPVQCSLYGITCASLDRKEKKHPIATCVPERLVHIFYSSLGLWLGYLSCDHSLTLSKILSSWC